MIRRCAAVLVAVTLLALAGIVARPETTPLGIPAAAAAGYQWYVCNPGNYWVSASNVLRWRGQGYTCYGVPTFCGRQC